ncbi:MAG TPA: hypothetical protein VE954_25680 [Oligoflexus sp.]|uniref:hypothetical protein n=1 Tax=Oligoflexus sp. TaxID=1971216 RepID=UPI002D648866|nr:hypothetical protein [Oligoflexus sp.]HYX36513.1 hypothetical protein [Oligoflexus sp.]
MSFTTLGFYLIYWGYKNWKIMKASGRTAAWPPICGLFLPFTLFSLLDKVKDEARAAGVSTTKLTISAFGFLMLGLLKMIPVVGILFNMSSFLALIPINRAFANINAAHQQSKPEYENFTWLNFTWFAVVAAWLAFHIVREIMRVS